MIDVRMHDCPEDYLAGLSLPAITVSLMTKLANRFDYLPAEPAEWMHCPLS